MVQVVLDCIEYGAGIVTILLGFVQLYRTVKDWWDRRNSRTNNP